ncbi:AarF/ABC1/UbiB kinase family protein [Novosphingobium sp. P6W]|uniref:ABC1 kinase family protein n=1 Tax=Novosphingobium sp. P6W TaxID=1609758 RepID=UPI0005C2F821|nr:AarF/ABC1/UbiB kinase family protein [Novosphingobium sp. P6W]AXB79111.1 AarF/ABC1/UbiB kinase family protein [Novosphingobium sp. P6W]KIS30446.1 ubiquinol-cytochrome C reductase [Novosphingobium sp. P6W]
MTDERQPRGRIVPTGRLSRLSRFGKLAGGIAGGAMAEGVRRLASGERPRMNDLLLTPGNAFRLADQLSHLRGAAMKLGQMISMDAGDILPPEFTQVLARLRDQAHHMTDRQLNAVLTAEWGVEWRQRLSGFQGTPLAAASIGQVHRGRLLDGREIAIKIQYPGIARSIDADVDNVATLLWVTGLLPRELEIAPLLAEAKRQLHEEANYLREAWMMERYSELVGNDPAYLVPKPIAVLTTQRILAMDYIEGGPIEDVVAAPQDTRDAMAKAMVQLVLRELFEWGIMQTDPNFANYRWQQATGKLVLLDFGAAREVPSGTVEGYRALLMAAIDGDRDAVRTAAVEAGFLGGAAAAKHRDVVDQMIDVILAELAKPGPFDFSERSFLRILREQAMILAGDRATWHLPPTDTLFVQRKISGTALLAAKFQAKADIHSMIAAYRDDKMPDLTGAMPTT